MKIYITSENKFLFEDSSYHNRKSDSSLINFVEKKLVNVAMPMKFVYLLDINLFYRSSPLRTLNYLKTHTFDSLIFYLLPFKNLNSVINHIRNNQNSNEFYYWDFIINSIFGFSLEFESLTKFELSLIAALNKFALPPNGIKLSLALYINDNEEFGYNNFINIGKIKAQLFLYLLYKIELSVNLDKLSYYKIVSKLFFESFIYPELYIGKIFDSSVIEDGKNFNILISALLHFLKVFSLKTIKNIEQKLSFLLTLKKLYDNNIVNDYHGFLKKRFNDLITIFIINNIEYFMKENIHLTYIENFDLDVYNIWVILERIHKIRGRSDDEILYNMFEKYGTILPYQYTDLKKIAFLHPTKEIIAITRLMTHLDKLIENFNYSYKTAEYLTDCYSFIVRKITDYNIVFTKSKSYKYPIYDIPSFDFNFENHSNILIFFEKSLLNYKTMKKLEIEPFYKSADTAVDKIFLYLDKTPYNFRHVIIKEQLIDVLNLEGIKSKDFLGSIITAINMGDFFNNLFKINSQNLDLTFMVVSYFKAIEQLSYSFVEWIHVGERFKDSKLISNDFIKSMCAIGEYGWETYYKPNEIRNICSHIIRKEPTLPIKLRNEFLSFFNDWAIKYRNSKLHQHNVNSLEFSNEIIENSLVIISVFINLINYFKNTYKL